MSCQQISYYKLIYLGFFFILFLQIIGIASFHINKKRLTEFDPWQPKYSNATVPLLARWDSGWYVAVAKDGYYLNPGENSTVVFFPLYPLLIAGLTTISGIDYFYVGQLISWLALFLALFYFYKLLRLDFEERHSYSMLLYLLVFPWSFFLAAVYTESLFFFLIVSSFFYARKQNWMLASIFGFFASLTRITGIFLFPALAYEYWVQNKKLDLKAFWLALIPAGLSTFILYLKFKTGDFLAFIHNQSSFGRSLTFPLQTLWRDIKNTLIFFQKGEILNTLVYALGMLVLVVSLYLLVKFHKRLRFSYLLFAYLSILLPLCTGTTTSLGRYLLNVFPVFIAAGLVENKFFRYGWLSLGSVLLTLLTFSFVAWHFVV